MWTAATLILLVFIAVASFDGFYFHLYRYRLYELPECRREHALHTLNAVLFPLTLAPLFLADTSGAWLWLAAALSAVTFGIETADVLSENESRERFGGLTPIEYWMHFAMSGFRWGYTALAFAAVPAAAWTADSAWMWRLPAFPDVLSFVPWGVALVGVPVAALHVALAIEGAPRQVAEALLWVRGVRPEPAA